MNRTAIVILNWNGLNYLKLFLGNVVRLSTAPDTEIIVADNGSNDGSVEWVKENHDKVKLIRFDENHGFAGGYNLALEKISAEYFVLLNSDIEATEGWLSPLISFLERNPDVAACQPKIRSYNNREYFEYAGAAGGFIDKYGFPFCRGRIFNVIEQDNGQYDDQTDIFWSTGACMAIKASAFKSCGGFDSAFFAHMEEIDLCWRLHKAGHRISYIPSSVVYHVGGGALPYDSPFKTYLNFRNSLFLLYKNLDDNVLHKTLFIRKLFDGLAALRFLFSGHPDCCRSVWQAHIDYYKNIKELKSKRAFVKTIETANINAPLMNKSLVFEFYARGRKTFSSLKYKIL